MFRLLTLTSYPGFYFDRYLWKSVHSPTAARHSLLIWLHAVCSRFLDHMTALLPQCVQCHAGEFTVKNRYLIDVKLQAGWWVLGFVSHFIKLSTCHAQIMWGSSEGIYRWPCRYIHVQNLHHKPCTKSALVDRIYWATCTQPSSLGNLTLFKRWGLPPLLHRSRTAAPKPVHHHQQCTVIDINSVQWLTTASLSALGLPQGLILL